MNSKNIVNNDNLVSDSVVMNNTGMNNVSCERCQVHNSIPNFQV